MAEANHDQADQPQEDRPRASLRGKGRKILLGQHASELDDTLSDASEQDKTAADHAPAGDINAASLPLTAEETDSLLEFARSTPDVPLSPMDVPDAPEPTPGPDIPAWWETDETPTDSQAAEPIDAPPLAERTMAQLAAEDERLYQASPELDELIPGEPEVWRGEPEARAETTPIPVTPLATEWPYPASDNHDGGPTAPQGATPVADPLPVGLPEPFDTVYERQPASELFDITEPANANLLDLLVDDDAIRRLAQQIDALQEDIATQVANDRDSADVYMNELLRASGLLMASRENYDDAKAIVYRVRADMTRERKIEADILRYRPLLLNYYIGWGISLGVLFLLKELFTGITDAVGVGTFSALYFPMLFGIVGALISGYLTLERHTTRLRDFDPIHVSWYLFNPLLGAVMGLIMFLIAAIANEDLLHDTGSTAERAITYLLCVIAGMNQNNVLRQLNGLLKRVGQPGNQ